MIIEICYVLLPLICLKIDSCNLHYIKNIKRKVYSTRPALTGFMIADGVENVVLLTVIENLLYQLLIRRGSLRHRSAKNYHV